MKSQVRVAVIGAGVMANRVHYPSLRDLQDVEIAAVCDLDPERLNTTADKYQIAGRYRDYKCMIEEVAPDAVYVIVPPLLVLPIVMDVLQRGLPVFLEKPPGITTDQARNLAREAERHDCLTMVGFNRRFIPVFVEAKKRVEAQGPIVHIVSKFYKNLVGHGPPQSGAIDLLRFDAIHAVDVLRWLGGEVKEVVGDVRSLYANHENCFSALVRFENGAVGILSTLWMAGARIHAFEMHAKGISAFVDGNSEAFIYGDQDTVNTKGSSTTMKPERLVLNADEVAGSAEFYISYGFLAENEHFIQSVQSAREPQTNLSDAVKTMELCDRIYYSQSWSPGPRW
jgi:virulence factor